MRNRIEQHRLRVDEHRRPAPAFLRRAYRPGGGRRPPRTLPFFLCSSRRARVPAYLPGWCSLFLCRLPRLPTYLPRRAAARAAYPTPPHPHPTPPRRAAPPRVRLDEPPPPPRRRAFSCRPGHRPFGRCSSRARAAPPRAAACAPTWICGARSSRRRARRAVPAASDRARRPPMVRFLLGTHPRAPWRALFHPDIDIIDVDILLFQFCCKRAWKSSDRAPLLYPQGYSTTPPRTHTGARAYWK